MIREELMQEAEDGNQHDENTCTVLVMKDGQVVSHVVCSTSGCSKYSFSTNSLAAASFDFVTEQSTTLSLKEAS